MINKSLSNKNTKDAIATGNDVIVIGNPDEWQLICKASSKSQGWMKSTKAMICGGGVLVQVSTEFRDKQGGISACSEALQFIPAATIDNNGDNLSII